MATETTPNVIGYEHPLSERVRTLLRLEDMFERVDYFLHKNDAHEHHVALLSIFEMLEVSGRADLKSDLLQELERQKQSLEALRENPDVSEEALDNVLWQIDQASSRLFQASGKIGQELRENEWLMSIRQRTNIPGGVCEFDLPSYHYWLQQGPEQHRHDLQQWLAPFLPIRDAIGIVLRLLRESGKTTSQVAYQGVYQQMMAGRIVAVAAHTPEARVPLRAGDQRQQVRAEHPLHDAGRHTAAQGSRSRRRIRAHVL